MPITSGIVPTPVSSVVGQPASTTAQNGRPDELSREAFLQLLVAQLRYQDPTSPMDSSAFMTQTSQLTSVEKLTELAATSRDAFAVQQRLGAASMVGQHVSWTADDGTTGSGTVDSVTLTGAQPVLRIGETDVPLDRVTRVAQPDPTP